MTLAERAVACKGWRWMPGMLTLDAERMSDEGWPLYDALDYGSSSVVESVEWCDTACMGALPDLTDPATLGCLLALVRQAWAKPGLHIRREGNVWRAWTDQPGAFVFSTEAEALVATLEAASCA